MPDLYQTGFNYKRAKRSGTFFCERVAVTDLANKFGTPLYVYSAERIRTRFREMDRAFRKIPHTICYSVKANSNLSILKLLAGLGAGFDVVSGGELERVLIADRKSAVKTVLSGVGKTGEEIRAALRAGILLFNIESESELSVLAREAASAKKRARMAVRVNPDVAAETHPYISTGMREHKFGVPVRDARRLYAHAAREKFLQPAGVSVHIGSQITEVAPFAATMRLVADLARELRDDGHKITYVDAGGGLGIPYKAQEIAPDLDAYAKAVMQPLRDLKIHLLLEPGRWIVGPAGALLTRVLYLKQNGNKIFAICDAAMNDLLRPALYRAHHEIVPVTLGLERKSVYDIVGPICETGDFFARDRELPELHEGDLLAVLDVGAYGMSLASNYNSRPRPAEVLVHGKKARLIRRREIVRDLTAQER
jgi:diaminopimelate decarboxylase